MISRLVIGGGPAGASLALRLARAGREVLVLERERAPVDKVCGEFLSFEAQADLQDLGLDIGALGAVPVEGVQVHRAHTRARAALPFVGQSLPRRTMDEALLSAAEAAGATVRRGARVCALERRGEGWAARLADGQVLEAAEVFLGTGKHDIRGWRRPLRPTDDLIGFKQHLVLEPGAARDLADQVELHLFKGGYAGLQPAPSGRANLCLVVRRGALGADGAGWPALCAFLSARSPSLDVRLRGARAETPRPLAVSAIPYGLVLRSGAGLWRLGDQAAVIPSFTGEGMSIALHSARLAAETHLAGAPAEAFQARLAGDVLSQVRRASFGNRLLISATGQRVAAGLLACAPGTLALIASATRIPSRARPVAPDRPPAPATAFGGLVSGAGS